MTWVKAVDFPYSPIASAVSSPDAGHFARLLSGVSFVGKAYSHVSTFKLPCNHKPTNDAPFDLSAQQGFALPFSGTDTCMVWYLDEHFSVEEFFKDTPQFHKKNTPKPIPVFYEPGGWARYDDDVNMLMNFLKPPLLFYCALPANGTTRLLCAFRSPGANMLTMTMTMLR